MLYYSCLGNFVVVVIQFLSCVWLFAIPWTAAGQAPLSMGFPRQEYWNGCHFLVQGIFPTQGLNLGLLPWQGDSLPLTHQGSPRHLHTLNLLHQLWVSQHNDMICTKEQWYLICFADIFLVYNLPFDSIYGFLSKYFHFYINL